jgi:regulator of sigma E protease
VYNLSGIFGNLFQGKGLPPGVELVGPIGVGSLMNQAIQTGPIYYLQFVAIIAIHLAVFNLLPIPALDGGKLLFLGIEKIKGSPINIKLEEKVSTLFFILLIIMIFFVSIKDIIKIF